MQIEHVIKESFAVIGKEGSTDEGEGVIGKLWEQANAGFGEIAHLAKMDEKGRLQGIWGAMSDFSHSFKPWEDEFSRGLYLAGIECHEDAQPPKGWDRWDIPGFEYLRVQTEDGIFPQMLEYIREQGMTLAEAVHDFTDPATGENYMYFPIRKL